MATFATDTTDPRCRVWNRVSVAGGVVDTLGQILRAKSAPLLPFADEFWMVDLPL